MEDYNTNITWKVEMLTGKKPLFYHKTTQSGITNVHHRKPCVTAQVALKTTGLHSCMEDLDSIVWDKDRSGLRPRRPEHVLLHLKHFLLRPAYPWFLLQAGSQLR